MNPGMEGISHNVRLYFLMVALENIREGLLGYGAMRSDEEHVFYLPVRNPGRFKLGLETMIFQGFISKLVDALQIHLLYRAF